MPNPCNFTLRKDGMPWGEYKAETLEDASNIFMGGQYFKNKSITLSFINEDFAVFTSKSGHQYTLGREEP